MDGRDKPGHDNSLPLAAGIIATKLGAVGREAESREAPNFAFMQASP